MDIVEESDEDAVNSPDGLPGSEESMGGTGKCIPRTLKACSWAAGSGGGRKIAWEGERYMTRVCGCMRLAPRERPTAGEFGADL